MEKTFDPTSVEARWRETWEQHGWFAPRGDGPAYSIMIPPPNVTGTLHMGHAFQHSIMDALTRYHRMLGDTTLWQPGTDHAGIATQMVVERNLKLAGEPGRAELGRERFVEKVWAWKAQSGGIIEKQIRRLGSSVDWSRNIFTMGERDQPDAGYPQAVIEHFVRLHEAGLIYRGKRLVNWDPVLQTAISDLEVVQEEESGKLWHIRYPLADGAKTLEGLDYIVVATTRPETMLGDAAVAVHPDDQRFAHLVGRKVMLPLCDREIPIIADDFVDREFGSGCVKITPAHDFNDYLVGLRNDLPRYNVLSRSGTVLDYPEHSFTNVAEQFDRLNEVKSAIGKDDVVANIRSLAPYNGLDRFEARLRVVADLQAIGLIEKIDDHKLKVPRGDRTGVVLEPYLTDQWFVDLTRETRHDGAPGPGGLKAITEPAIRAVEDGRIKFVPENWSNTYFHWLRNIQDWCISRQLWWGHRIPAWYDVDGNVYVGRSEDEVRAKHPHLQAVEGGSRPALRQDEDVFDTWFSSDIWPLATLGWPDATPELGKFYPSSVLVTGFDIIFFWVARMVMMGLWLMDDAPPFREVYIHGLIRDPEGQKMSKSKGNVLDPLDLVDGISLAELVAKRTTGLLKPETAPKIEKITRRDYPNGIEAVGVDALRFTFLALASPGRDIRFDTGRAAGYRNFCNKLWNAARFVLMNCEGQDCGQDASLPFDLSVADRWIVSRLQKVEAEAAEHFAAYRFDLLAKTLYEFVWNDYCDWYLELTKPVFYGETNQEGAETDISLAVKYGRGTRRTLVRVLETILRLLHPLTPFVTEEIWQLIAPLAAKAGDTIMLQPYPRAQPDKIDEDSEADVEWLKGFILGVRQIRSGMNIAPAKTLPLRIQNASPADRERLERLRPLIVFFARVAEPLQLLAASDVAPESATALLGEMKILVPMAGLIDKDAEVARLARLIAKLEGDLEKNQARLASEKFVSGAPPAVLEKERERVVQQSIELATLRQQQARIAAM